MKTGTVKITLSAQALKYIDKLISVGVYGQTRAAVCARLVDAALIEKAKRNE